MAVVQIETRRTELEGTLQMIREGWAYCDSQGEERVTSQAFYDKLSAELDALIATGAATGTSREGTPDALRPITSRPLAGSRAANQFGEFEVKYATVKQVRFIQSLLENRDLTLLEGAHFMDLDALRAQVLTCKINKKAASAAIDTLLKQPELPKVPSNAPSSAPVVKYPASAKQVDLIKRLVTERDWQVPAIGQNSDAEAIQALLDGEIISGRDASNAITYLFGCGKVAQQARPELDRTHTGPWVHATTWNVYRVYYGRQSGRMLAKIWVPFAVQIEGEPTGDWEYAGQADRFVNPARDHKMTRDEAAAWGQNSGNCCVCGADLSDPSSIDAGIGPVCARSYR